MRHIIIVLLALLLGGCADVKPIARTINDAARVACDAAFGKQPPPQEVSVEEVCEHHERLQPFIDGILAARREVGAGIGEEGGAED